MKTFSAFLLAVLLSIPALTSAVVLIGETGDPTDTTPIIIAADEYYFGPNNLYTGTAGTATQACARISAWGTATGAKVCVYDSSGQNPTCSAEFDSTDGVGSDWYCGSITMSPSAVNYILAIAINSGTTTIIYANSAGTTWNVDKDQSGSYASPPTDLTEFTNGTGSINWYELALRVEGTTGGGGGGNPIHESLYLEIVQ